MGQGLNMKYFSLCRDLFCQAFFAEIRCVEILSMKTGSIISKCWWTLRHVTGDDAYDRYLDYTQARHTHEDERPLTRQEFFSREQERKWNGVRRCC